MFPHNLATNAIAPRFPLKKTALAVSGALLAGAGFSAAVQAQDTKTLQLEEVVVTGTLIRGIEPTGSQTIGIDADAILESGASTATDILATLPQATNLFNGNTALNPEAPSVITITRPNLRNLPGFSTSTGAATLILIDGHRVVGMGVQQSAVDPDLIPSSVIERVEVVTDGGSSLYGADAIGGVINFITRDEFEGVEVDAGYSFGDEYWSYDASVTAGTAWESGSGYVALSYSDRDAILGRDRDWSRGGQWTADGLQNSYTQCYDPVGTTTTYESTDFGGLIAPLTVWSSRDSQTVGEPCWEGGPSSLVPEEDRTGVFASITQELADYASLDFKAYYSDRNTNWDYYPIGSATSFGPAQFELTDGLPPGEFTEGGSVGFSFEPHSLYRQRAQTTEIDTFGMTPELTISLGGDWQMRALLHYSRSESSFVEPQSNQIALQEAIAAGLFDPLNVAAADDAAMAEILDWEYAGEAVQQLFLARVIADGAIIELPAGPLSMAIGAEYQDQKARQRVDETVIGGLGAQPYPEISRDVNALFAELSVPIISGVTGIESLTLSASVRHDDYSDFGTTTNPHIGITWEPVDWIAVHANWGESFNAPTLMDALGANAILGYNTAVVGLVEDAAAAVGVTIEEGREDVAQITGADADLDPQTADTWAAGFEITPPVLDGLRITANYYEIEFYDILGSFDPRTTTSAVAFRDRYIWNPTQAELEAAAAETVNGAEEIAGRDASKVAAIIDRRTTNTDQAILKGVDFGISYFQDTSFGALTYQLSGNHQTEFKIASAGRDFVDVLESGSATTLASAAIGLQMEQLRAKLTFNYTDSFDVTDAAAVDGVPLQDKVDSYLTTDLFVGYDFAGEGMTEGLSVRFLVNNLFDEDPPIYRRNDIPSFSGFTRGQVFTFGVTKRF